MMTPVEYILTQEGKLHDWREIITCGWCRGSGIPRSSVDDLRDCWSCDGRGYRMRRWA